MDFKTFFLELGFIGLFLVQYGHTKDFDLESTPATWEDAKRVCGGSGNMMVPGRRYRAKALVRSLKDGQEVWLNGWRAASGSQADAEGKLSTVKVDFSRTAGKPIKVVCRLESVMYDPYFEAEKIEDARAICKKDGAALADIDTEEDIAALTTKLVEDTPHWINSMSSTASPIKQCLMAKRVDNDVVYNYDDCERQLHFICLKDDGLIDSFSPLISLKKARYDEFQHTIEQHLSSLSSVVMAESSTTVPETSVPTTTSTSSSLILSDSVPSVTSISPSESSSFTLSAVKDTQSEIITPSQSMTYSDSQSSSEAEQLTPSVIPVLTETKSDSIEETKSAESSSAEHTLAASISDVIIPSTESVYTESESLEPSSSSVTEVLASQSEDDYERHVIDMRTNIFEVSSKPSSHVPIVTTPTDADLYDDKFTDEAIVDSMSDYDFPGSTSESDTQYSMPKLDTYSSIPSYDTFTSTPVYDTQSEYDTEDGGLDLAGGLQTSFTSEYRDQTTPLFAQKTSVSHAILSETDLIEPPSDISETMASDYIPIIRSTSMTDTATLRECEESDPYTVCSDSTTQKMDESSSDLYYKIMPSKYVDVIESSPIHPKDKDMGKMSGTEQTYISSSPSEYSEYDSNDFDDTDTYDDTSKELFSDIPARSYSYSEITPSKSIDIMESSTFPTKDKDISEESGREKTYIPTTPSVDDVPDSSYYDSTDIDDSETYDMYTDKFDETPTTPPVIVVEGVTVETVDDSEHTKVDTNIDGDVSKEDDDDDDNRLGNQSADKTLGAKAKEPKEETEVGLWVAFSILVLLVIVAVILAVFLWRRRQKQKSKDITKPNGAAPPPGETVELRDSRSPSRENGATRETATFKDPAYDI